MKCISICLKGGGRIERKRRSAVEEAEEEQKGSKEGKARD